MSRQRQELAQKMSDWKKATKTHFPVEFIKIYSPGNSIGQDVYIQRNDDVVYIVDQPQNIDDLDDSQVMGILTGFAAFKDASFMSLMDYMIESFEYDKQERIKKELEKSDEKISRVNEDAKKDLEKISIEESKALEEFENKKIKKSEVIKIKSDYEQQALSAIALIKDYEDKKIAALEAFEKANKKKTAELSDQHLAIKKEIKSQHEKRLAEITTRPIAWDSIKQDTDAIRVDISKAETEYKNNLTSEKIRFAADVKNNQKILNVILKSRLSEINAEFKAFKRSVLAEYSSKAQAEIDSTVKKKPSKNREARINVTTRQAEAIKAIRAETRRVISSIKNEKFDDKKFKREFTVEIL